MHTCINSEIIVHKVAHLPVTGEHLQSTCWFEAPWPVVCAHQCSESLCTCAGCYKQESRAVTVPALGWLHPHSVLLPRKTEKLSLPATHFLLF